MKTNNSVKVNAAVIHNGEILMGCATVQANGAVAFVPGRSELGGAEKFAGCETISTPSGKIIYKIEDSHPLSDASIAKMVEEARIAAEKDSLGELCPKCHSYCYGDCR